MPLIGILPSVPVARLLSHVLDFCYPAACAHCNETCLTDSFLCDSCGAKLQKLADAPRCMKCAMPLVTDGAPCPYCLGRGLSPINQIVRLGVFNSPLKDLIHQLKYHRRWTLAESLADELAKLDSVQGLIKRESVLVPVPLHILRHVSRGYNQSEIIARRLRRHFRCHLAQPVRRIRNTITQTHIHARAEREANMRGAFALKSTSQLTDRNVIIVDDVMTTGSTLRAFARTLKTAQPASISAVTIAVADPKHQDFQGI
jgi:ComF family protein